MVCAAASAAGSSGSDSDLNPYEVILAYWALLGLKAAKDQPDQLVILCLLLIS